MLGLKLQVRHGRGHPALAALLLSHGPLPWLQETRGVGITIEKAHTCIMRALVHRSCSIQCSHQTQTLAIQLEACEPCLMLPMLLMFLMLHMVQVLNPELPAGIVPGLLVLRVAGEDVTGQVPTSAPEHCSLPIRSALSPGFPQGYSTVLAKIKVPRSCLGVPFFTRRHVPTHCAPFPLCRMRSGPLPSASRFTWLPSIPWMPSLNSAGPTQA